jgi:hypothetical protein
MLLVLSLMIWIPVTARANEIPQNMRFDPPPHVGDTSVSGTCSQTTGCDGMVDVALVIGGNPAESPSLGQGPCVDGRFTIDLSLCPPDSPGPSHKNRTICPTYALKAGDVISAAQWTLAYQTVPCDTTPLFTVGLGIPTITQWGVVALSILLALSAIVLIRRRRRA